MRCRPFVEKGDLGIKLEQTGDGPAGGEVNVINSKYTQTRFGFAYAWWSAHNAAKYCEKDKDIANGMEFIDQDKARSDSSHWSPYDRVRVVNADP